MEPFPLEFDDLGLPSLDGSPLFFSEEGLGDLAPLEEVPVSASPAEERVVKPLYFCESSFLAWSVWLYAPSCGEDGVLQWRLDLKPKGGEKVQLDLALLAQDYDLKRYAAAPLLVKFLSVRSVAVLPQAPTPPTSIPPLALSGVVSTTPGSVTLAPLLVTFDPPGVRPVVAKSLLLAHQGIRENLKPSGKEETHVFCQDGSKSYLFRQILCPQSLAYSENIQGNYSLPLSPASLDVLQHLVSGASLSEVTLEDTWEPADLLRLCERRGLVAHLAVLFSHPFSPPIIAKLSEHKFSKETCRVLATDLRARKFFLFPPNVPFNTPEAKEFRERVRAAGKGKDLTHLLVFRRHALSQNGKISKVK